MRIAFRHETWTEEMHSEGNTKNRLPRNLQKVDSSGPMDLSLASKEELSTEGNNLNTEDEGLIGSESALQQGSEKPEHLWKATVAAQISQTAAFSSRVRLQLQKTLWMHKEIAHTLAEAVMEFWHTLQVMFQGKSLR
ncbi:hypothetical protein Tco_0097188 [Tanacetum coccineum]